MSCLSIFRTVILVSALVALFAVEINGQECTECVANATSCIGKYNTCKTFICGDTPPTGWYELVPGGKNLTSAAQFAASPDHSLVGRVLTLKQLTAKTAVPVQMHGFNVPSTLDYNTICNHNILTYDLDNAPTPNITFDFDYENILRQKADGPSRISTTIDSFEDKLNYTFGYEALPIDTLTVNGKEVATTKKCEPGNSWAGCLEHSGHLQLKRCEQAHLLQTSYNVKQLKEFSDAGISITPAVKEYIVELSFPPKVKQQTKLVTYELLGTQMVPLNCEVECGNPGVFTFHWTNDNEWNEISDTAIYNYMLPAGNGPFTAYCTVTNGQATEHPEESRTKFTIQYQAKTTPTIPTTTVSGGGRRGLTDLEIAGISIGSIILVALIIGGIVLCCWCSKKREREAAVTRNVPNKSTLDHELTDNPVYGTKATFQTQPKTPNLNKVSDKTDNSKYTF